MVEGSGVAAALPDPKINGGQGLSSRIRLMKNRGTFALQMGALECSHSFLGEYFHKMKARMGTPKAMTKSVHKLARIVYHAVTNQQEYDAPWARTGENPRTRWQAEETDYAHGGHNGFRIAAFWARCPSHENYDVFFGPDDGSWSGSREPCAGSK
jgi:hypothetical protein